jgi:hypothetical protein
MLSNTSSDFELIVRQQPNRARVAGGKEKGTWKTPGSNYSYPRASFGMKQTLTWKICSSERKPVDPPPIVQLRVREEGSYLAQ